MGQMQALTFWMTQAKALGLGNGLLYNWYAVTDARNICPIGWRVLSDAEWYVLEQAIDPTINDHTFEWRGIDTGTKLKEAGTDHWHTANGTNESGFNARGAGFRTESGSFNYLTYQVIFWATDSYGSYGSYFMLIDSGVDSSKSYRAIINKKTGSPLRPIKDSTILTDGQSGTYVGNDGKRYRTICINGVEYLADNLAETKFRNGDTIPEVTDNAAWAALTTPGLCAYNNEWNNV